MLGGQQAAAPPLAWIWLDTWAFEEGSPPLARRTPFLDPPVKLGGQPRCDVKRGRGGAAEREPNSRSMGDREKRWRRVRGSAGGWTGSWRLTGGGEGSGRGVDGGGSGVGGEGDLLWSSCGRLVDSGVGVCAEVGVDDGLATCEAESCSGAQCASRAASRSGVGLAPDEVEGDARTHWPTGEVRGVLGTSAGGPNRG